ncbi:uncharacterized protein A4U43_C07F19570 [Asparagus officinalis]|uniref:Uncharacterized protein n=1 Tax=Asparagus officinalis TaxID=4686 RepID=A0A5P1EG93_ASPOF|nr:uncharacterized protein A4U43_C07F19570 [Asparagus officinalis]
MRPMKCLHQDLALEEVAVACDQGSQIVTRLAGSRCIWAVQVEKKKRLRKVGSQGRQKRRLRLDVVCINKGLLEREEGPEKDLLSLSSKEDELGDWRQEMEVRESMIEGWIASDNQKSIGIDKLKCELLEQNKRVRHLSEEVVHGRRERNRALEQAEVDRHVA